MRRSKFDIITAISGNSIFAAFVLADTAAMIAIGENANNLTLAGVIGLSALWLILFAVICFIFSCFIDDYY